MSGVVCPFPVLGKGLGVLVRVLVGCGCWLWRVVCVMPQVVLVTVCFGVVFRFFDFVVVVGVSGLLIWQTTRLVGCVLARVGVVGGVGRSGMWVGRVVDQTPLGVLVRDHGDPILLPPGSFEQMDESGREGWAS